MPDEQKLREDIARISKLQHDLEVIEARLGELKGTTDDRAIEEGRRLFINKRMNELATIAEVIKKEIEKLKNP